MRKMMMLVGLVMLAGCRTATGGTAALQEIAAPVQEPVPWQTGVGEADDLPTARLIAEFDAKVRVFNWVGGEYSVAEQGERQARERTETRLSASIEAVMRACGGLSVGEETFKRLSNGRVRATVKIRPRVGMLNGPDARAACGRAVVEVP